MAREQLEDEIIIWRSVSEGARFAHVWRSPQYPGADMTIAFRWAGTIANDNEHGLSQEFAEDVAPYYDGILTPEEVAGKLALIEGRAQLSQLVVE